MLSDEHEMKNQLLAFYKSKFPSYQNSEIKHFNRITDGWETEVYSFNLEYEEKNSLESHDLILRVYPGTDAYQKSSREFSVLQKLHELQYPVPEVFLLVRDDSPFKQPFVIMERIDGSVMGEKVIRIIEGQKQFVRLFFDLHQLDWTRFNPDTSLYLSQKYLESVLEKYHDFIVDSHRKPGFLPVIKWLEKQSSTINFLRFSVIHYDFHPNNIIIRKSDNKSFVIDWGSWEVADFRMDLAWTLLLASSYYGSQMRDFILKEYESISGVGVENIEFFDVIACTRRLFSIVVSLSEGAQALGMRPGAEETIKEDVSHIKKVYSQLQKITGENIPEVDIMIDQLEN